MSFINKIFLPILYISAITISYGQTRSCDETVALPDIKFKKKSVHLTKKAKEKLDTVFKIFKMQSFCKLLVISNAVSCEECYQTSWDKTYSIIKYLKQKGIDSSRMIFRYGSEGDLEIAHLSFTIEDGPNYVPAPYSLF